MFRKAIIAACMLLLCISACAQTQFDEIREMVHGYSAVCVDGKWGVVDAQGKIVLPPKNDVVHLEDDGTLLYLQQGKVHTLNLKTCATAVPNLDADASTEPNDPSPSPEVIPTTPPSSGEDTAFKLQPRQGPDNYMYGYVNEAGEWVVPPQFEDAGSFHGEYAIVRLASGKCGVIDQSGAYVLEPEYNVLSPFANGITNGYLRAAIQIREDDPEESSGGSVRNIWGVIDLSGKVHVPIDYDEIGSLADDNTFTATFNEKKTIFQITEDGIREVREVASSLSLEDYMPFTGKKVAKLKGEPTLEKRASAKHGHPRLDGATALFPVYAAIVEAVYPDETRYGDPDYDTLADKNTLITCTKTKRAYERLMEGKADIIFCAEPSDAQVRAAKAMGVEFELTPFGKEAFVFIVNKENPLENISVEQIRSIYSGKTTQWEEMGVPGLGEIIAYQRPADSGSQTALEKLMGDTPVMEAPLEYIPSFMEDIIQNVEYRNLANALGYSFRFFCTEMAEGDVKLLSINGVAPTVENIRSGSYPITSTLYMVTRKGEENPNVQALMDWVLSEQGKELIEKSGYVAIEG